MTQLKKKVSERKCIKCVDRSYMEDVAQWEAMKEEERKKKEELQRLADLEWEEERKKKEEEKERRQKEWEENHPLVGEHSHPIGIVHPNYAPLNPDFCDDSDAIYEGVMKCIHEQEGYGFIKAENSTHEKLKIRIIYPKLIIHNISRLEVCRKTIIQVGRSFTHDLRILP